jgi:hypothetical protein
VKGLLRSFAAAIAVAGGLSAIAPDAGAAEEFRTLRLRPQTVPFVTPEGSTVRRVVSFYLTTTKDAAREICSRQAELKSIFLVTSYNRRLADAKWRFDLMNLGTDLYRALGPVLGREKLVAVHLALGTGDRQREVNEIQKRLEELEDCTTVRGLPKGAVTARYSDTLTAPARSLASDAENALPPASAPNSAAEPVAPEETAPEKPFETHPQMRTEPAPEIDLAKTGISSVIPEEKPGPCGYDISDLWPPRWITLGDERFRLARATTIDADANGKVEDVSFVLAREDGSELETTYRNVIPTPASAEITGLTLPDPMLIFRLCHGTYEFPMPGATMKSKMEARPDLAAEVAARIKGEPAAPPPEAAADFWRWVAAIVSITAVVMAALVLLVFYLMARRDRRRKADRRRKKRRKGDRRRRDNGYSGDERRKGGDRREDSDRRDEEPRRRQRDRRGGGQE